MKKNIFMFTALALVVLVLAFTVKIQSVDEYYLTHIDDINEDSQTVYLTIDCSTILNNYNDLDTALQSEKYVPSDGKILKKSEYVLRSGDSAFDILSRAVKHNKIQMEFQGADQNSLKTVYIQGINYLYEFSCGPLSGWMYKVNGRFPQQGCSAYKLKDGDNIEFVYSCNMGKDIDAVD